MPLILLCHIDVFYQNKDTIAILYRLSDKSLCANITIKKLFLCNVPSFDRVSQSERWKLPSLALNFVDDLKKISC